MRARVVLVLALLALTPAAGCGGDDEEASETIPPAPELTIPGEGTPTLDDLPETDTTGTDADGLAGGETPPAAGEPPPADGGAGGGSAPSGGQPAPQDSPENDTPPPANSPAERFEEFCSENPGAC